MDAQSPAFRRWLKTIRRRTRVYGADATERPVNGCSMGAEVSCPANVPARSVQLFRQPGFCAPAFGEARGGAASRCRPVLSRVMRVSPLVGLGPMRLARDQKLAPLRSRCLLARRHRSVRPADRRQLGCNRDKLPSKRQLSSQPTAGQVIRVGRIRRQTQHQVTSRGATHTDGNGPYRNFSAQGSPGPAVGSVDS